MGFNIANAALRLVSGAYILNSGIGKLRLPAESAQGLHSMTANAIPQVEKLEPAVFGKAVAVGEIGLGAALLTPFLPSRLVGLGLGAFAAGLVAVYLKTPGLTESDGIRPTANGGAMAKDFWLAGIAAALVFGRGKAKTKIKEVAKPAK
ncbi:DoxX family membrane protein [Paeniglutamicibacter psychrophenolicus]|uniref:Membrane protein YphA (DoxX/SURF4 family) n=1 Tax=Paeniglutamicibacter psychrophenolicus TaxID=257454 RepID=A0ABS4WBI0_9MICC|nr:DoxX family membrane protein [Paeniglutamicibacter psychrophenolicus]MBP2373564.1 putative membrane protein YphA (DoxX/SURF4 family) [Paeniglutamicibacter psychrophenolicus]